ncbi:MAG: hypothetical protein JW771_07615 [Candidatus Thermoplasmatota archaeon]|nr:hypothetical protein [Candidatus Thermoplasmatota archaeon]
MNRNFLDAKEKALAALDKACNDKDVDAQILSLLDDLNAFDEYYTSSSCAGRIVVLELPCIGDKQHAHFLGKWHHQITVEDVTVAVKKATSGLIWILAQSPIVHVGATTTASANHLVNLANSCGFKHSTLKSAGKKFMVEICSTERLDAPIGNNGTLLCRGEYLDLLVTIANEVMERSQQKLNRLEQELHKRLSTYKTTTQ